MANYQTQTGRVELYVPAAADPAGDRIQVKQIPHKGEYM